MAVLLNLDKISKSFGAKALFTDLCLTVNDGDRIGIIGDNGTGKTTLTKIMVNMESADTGNIAIRKNLKTAYIPQVSNYEADATVWDIVAKTATTDFKNADVKTATALSIVGFDDYTVKVNTLSGGWSKRLDIACGIVNEPELLILDEPTNHLDYQALDWLENFLGSARFTWVMVSHDRFLLEQCANRIVEINKRYDGNIFQSEGRYDDFLEKHLLYIEQQNKLEAVMSNKVRAEIEWLRRGPKARRTKAKYRIDEAHHLIKELADLKEKKANNQNRNRFQLSSNRKTKVLVKIKNISKSFGDKHILKNFTANLTTGLRIGLLGGNGVGKSTLLKLLSKQVEPDAGSVEHADNLKIVYFDQLRESLHQQKTVKQYLADGNDTVIFKDRPVHMVSWIKRFGFSPQQLDSTIASLSGGEQARILIAKLMLQPADILLLDEPTNDLDIRTIETLEENLLEFGGLLVIVSHDRYMISRVCGLFIGFTTDAQAELFADYEQWEESLKTNKKENGDARKTVKDKRPKKEKTKLSYKEKLELQDAEKQIEILDDKIKSLEAQLSDPENFSDFILLNKLTEEIALNKEALEKFYRSWEYLAERAL
ncbi:MAG: ABC-F family ATP-binding cassette domain-containing protein [Desulfobacterales bacterium]|nr:ABC-F family ATP-binding cassette domain-containing protein [Desulfobacterales bacterium]